VIDGRRRLPSAEPHGRTITFDFEGRPVRAHEGEPVAVALFAAGIRLLARSPKYHRPRGLFCAAGHCASCHLRIDGQPNIRSCAVPAREGLRCERQNAFPDADVDLLGAADWLFPSGMDHHRLMTGTRIGNELFLKLVRQMGGTGTLPDAPAERLPPAREESVDLCVVGAGPAGLAAARVAAEARPRARVLVLDDQDCPGGSLLSEPGGVARGRALAEAARAAGARLRSLATALAYYPEDRVAAPPSPADGPPGLLAVAEPDGLVKVAARRFLYTTGAYDQNLPFANNDRPGVLAARAVGRLAFRFGVRPGRRAVFVTETGARLQYLSVIADGLEALGIPVTMADEPPPGRLDLGRDVLAVAALPAPASELPRHHGAFARLDLAKGGFAIDVDAGFATSVPHVFAAGDVTGYLGPEAAAAAGAAAGAAVAATL
jgi:sarcosine oxidase, subunit alpha